MNAKSSQKTVASDAALYWLARLEASDLSPAEHLAFENWLAASPANQLAYLHAEQLWDRGLVLKDVSQINVSPKLARRGLKPLVSMAGALACIVFILVIAMPFLRSGPTETTEYTAGAGEVVDVILPDGSSVFLHAKSRILVSYSASLRSVELTSGEAFFKVIKDEQRPFDVNTSLGRARALGTAFSMNQNAEVTVLEGKVGLAHSSDTFEPLIVLQSDQQLSVIAAADGQMPLKVDANSKLAWRKKRLVYRGETLGAVIRELEKFYDKDVTADDPALLASNVVIVLELSDFNTTVSTLAKALGLHAEISGDGTAIELHATAQ